MGERIKRITGSLYWRQFMLTAGMVVLTMALLGVSFYALSYNYTVSEKRQEMQDRAVLVAQLSVDYFTAGDDAERDQGDALRSLAWRGLRMTDVDFLIATPPAASADRRMPIWPERPSLSPRTLPKRCWAARDCTRAAAPWAYMRKSSSWWACP